MIRLLFSLLFLACFVNSVDAQKLWDDDTNYECHVYSPNPYTGEFCLLRFRGDKAIYRTLVTDWNYWDTNKFQNYCNKWVKENWKMNGSLNVVGVNFSNTFILQYVEDYGDRVIYKMENTYPLLYRNQVKVFYYAFSKDKKKLYTGKNNSLDEARYTQRCKYEIETYSEMVDLVTELEKKRGNGQIYSGGSTTSSGTVNSSIGNNNSSSSSNHKCNVCNGTGRMTKSWYVSSNYETYCTICQRKFNHGHSHVTCTTCNGKGYW